jgi:hypothetical protein
MLTKDLWSAYSPEVASIVESNVAVAATQQEAMHTRIHSTSQQLVRLTTRRDAPSYVSHYA